MQVNNINIENFNNLKLKITSNKINDNNYDLLITIESPEIESDIYEPYNDIVLCIDTSGSMLTRATNNNYDRSTILDILKYSAISIIESCDEKQRIGIVAFSDIGRVVCELTILNEKGKKMLIDNLNNLKACSTTNLYDGIIKSWELLKSSSINKTILLFTDGEPSYFPPKGYIEQLREIKETIYNGKYICDVNIYTYGNRVDSELCNLISKETNGVYGFIYDSTSISDLITRKISVIRSTICKDVILGIEFGSSIINVNMSESIDYMNTSSNAKSINVGNILNGCNRNFMFNVETNGTPPEIYASIYNDDIIKNTNNTCDDNGDKRIRQETIIYTDDFCDITYNNLRQEGIKLLNNIIKNKKEKYCDENLNDSLYNDFMLKINDNNDVRVNNLKKTFDDQVKIAYKQYYYNNWGKHYMLGLICSLKFEQYNNIKDVCVEHFGGVKFKSHVNRIISIFETVLQGELTNRLTNERTINAPTNNFYPTQSSIDVNQYINTRDGACFHGLSVVLMFDGTTKFVKDISENDSVMLGNNEEGKIECVVKTLINASRPIALTKLSNELYLTPYHPVKSKNMNHWVFPKDIKNISVSNLVCNIMYSFVLTENTRSKLSGIMIGGYECATLGHNIEDDDCIKHSFFGTELVINNLKQSKHYKNGFVVLDRYCLIRDKNTQLVKRINMDFAEKLKVITNL